jgi:hypothetical protein
MRLTDAGQNQQRKVLWDEKHGEPLEHRKERKLILF